MYGALSVGSYIPELLWIDGFLFIVMVIETPKMERQRIELSWFHPGSNFCGWQTPLPISCVETCDVSGYSIKRQNLCLELEFVQVFHGFSFSSSTGSYLPQVPIRTYIPLGNHWNLGTRPWWFEITQVM